MSESSTLTHRTLPTVAIVALSVLAFVALGLVFGGFFVPLRAGILVGVVAALTFIGAILTLLGVWVYRDAQRQGMAAPLWVVIVLLAPVVGLIAYAVVREMRQR